MQLARDMKLNHIVLHAPEMGVDPMPFIKAAQEVHPWLAHCDQGILVTEYQAIKDLMSMDDILRVPSHEIVDLMGAEGTRWGRFVLDTVLSSEGERHTRLRGSVNHAFSPRAANQMRPRMRAEVTALLNEWTHKGEFDFVEFAGQFPVRVMFGIIGADPVAIPEIQRSLEVHGASFDLDTSKMLIIEQAYQHLWSFVDNLIVERGSEGEKDDLLDQLILAKTSGALTHDELRQMLILLFAAGFDTTKNTLSLLLYAMINHPEIWARCAEDKEYTNKVVEESLRYASPSSAYRVVSEPFEYREVGFKKGDMLIFPLSISGRDPVAFPDPMNFDPDRERINRHMAFGRGMHMCLGQFMARANIEEGAHLMAQRIKNPRLAGEVVWRPFPGTWGIRKLPVRFDPA